MKRGLVLLSVILSTVSLGANFHAVDVLKCHLASITSAKLGDTSRQRAAECAAETISSPLFLATGMDKSLRSQARITVYKIWLELLRDQDGKECTSDVFNFLLDYPLSSYTEEELPYLVRLYLALVSNNDVYFASNMFIQSNAKAIFMAVFPIEIVPVQAFISEGVLDINRVCRMIIELLLKQLPLDGFVDYDNKLIHSSNKHVEAFVGWAAYGLLLEQSVRPVAK